jgi:ubiquinol-cytochrome c reductase cytochrome c subunit
LKKRSTFGFSWNTAIPVVTATALLILSVSSALAQGSASSGNAENGRRIFFRDGCYQCHGWVAQGGTGPHLTPPAIALPAMTAIVRKGVGGMPRYTSKVLSDSELADIHAYLETIKPPPPLSSITLLYQ